MSTADPSAVLAALADLGWRTGDEAHVTRAELAGGSVARVVMESKRFLRIHAVPGGEFWAEPAGQLRHAAAGREELPAVGDWVVVRRELGAQRAIIERVLPRHSALMRMAPGRTGERQVLATNVDTAFILSSAGQEMNPRRIERYLALVAGGGVQAVLLVTKCDLVQDISAALALARQAVGAVPVHALSTRAGTGLADVRGYLAAGRTGVLLGSSGVGKSTLVNTLLGRPLQRVQEVSRQSEQGRHTTTARSLHHLPGGGILIDTPGLRELQLGGDVDSLRQTFADVLAYALDCRFRDCRHVSEPDCAVLAAIATGQLAAERHRHYLLLLEELESRDSRGDKPGQTR